MSSRDKYLYKLNKGAWSSTQQQACSLRQAQTEAEKKLWHILRNRQLKGRKFRRQHPVSKYILDFYCNECKLGIELDGSVHNKIENILYDEDRERELNELGIKVIRFWNRDVINNVEEVIKRIIQHL